MGSLPIGTISEGTLKAEDLIPEFLGALKLVKLSREERKLARVVESHYRNRPHETDNVEDVDLDTLHEILSNHAPEYCYFGTHPGDGAHFGVWVDWNSIDMAVADGEMVKSEGLPSARLAKVDYWLQVNERGNVTLWGKQQAGKAYRWVKVWEVV